MLFVRHPEPFADGICYSERLKIEQPGLVHAAKKGESVVDPEAGILSSQHKDAEVQEDGLEKISS